MISRASPGSRALARPAERSCSSCARRPGNAGWRATIAAWRQRLSAHIRSRLEGGAGGIAAAFATGDQGGISEEDAEAMRASGLAHLLSVSGLHLTAVVGAVMLLTLRLLALSPTLALRWPLLVIAAGRGRGGGHRLHPADRRGGADHPGLYRRRSGPHRHRARPRGADTAAGGRGRADRAAALARIAGRAQASSSASRQ